MKRRSSARKKYKPMHDYTLSLEEYYAKYNIRDEFVKGTPAENKECFQLFLCDRKKWLLRVNQRLHVQNINMFERLRRDDRRYVRQMSTTLRNLVWNPKKSATIKAKVSLEQLQAEEKACRESLDKGFKRCNSAETLVVRPMCSKHTPRGGSVDEDHYYYIHDSSFKRSCSLNIVHELKFDSVLKLETPLASSSAGDTYDVKLLGTTSSLLSKSCPGLPSSNDGADEHESSKSLDMWDYDDEDANLNINQ